MQVRVVTLTGHLGSMGQVATLVARDLGFQLAGRELMIEAASALGWTEEQVEAFDERTGGAGGRLTRFLHRIIEQSAASGLDPSGLEATFASSYGDTAVPEMRASDRLYFDTLTSVLRSLADEGGVVLVGRGGQALFADRDDAVHVRIACAAEERARRVAVREGIEADAARTRVEESDREREAWHEKYFGIDYHSPYHYHLVVNTGSLSDTLAASLVVEAVRGLEAVG
jgi:cytidylate kinase